MIEMEEEATQVQTKLDEKEKLISKLEKKVETLEQGLAKGDVMTAQNLDGMADLEAKLAFVTNERNEMQQEFEFMTQTRQTEIVNLKEKLQEAEERYNEARSDQV